MKLKSIYDTSSQLLLSCKNGLDSHFPAPFSFECSFIKVRLAGITLCADAYHLFRVPSLKIEDLEAIPASTLSVPNQALQMYCGTQHSPYTDYGT